MVNCIGPPKDLLRGRSWSWGAGTGIVNAALFSRYRLSKVLLGTLMVSDRSQHEGY